MDTKKVYVSIMVNVNNQIVFKDITLYWIESDDAQTIADDVKDAILNIE